MIIITYQKINHLNKMINPYHKYKIPKKGDEKGNFFYLI